jgi:integrase
MLQLLKETGMRVGEAWNLRWSDVDFERATINVLPEKNSDARQPRISNRLISLLNHLPRPYPLVFRDPKVNGIESIEHFRRNYIKTRQRENDRRSQQVCSARFHQHSHTLVRKEFIPSWLCTVLPESN